MNNRVAFHNMVRLWHHTMLLCDGPEFLDKSYAETLRRPIVWLEDSNLPLRNTDLTKIKQIFKNSKRVLKHHMHDFVEVRFQYLVEQYPEIPTSAHARLAVRVLCAEGSLINKTFQEQIYFGVRYPSGRILALMDDLFGNI
jgi:hypothetical protein